MFEVRVPAVGESVSEGEVYQWHKATGDFVELDEVLVEIETDKATVEIVAEKAGVVEVVAKEGDTVQVGDLLAKIDTSAAAGASGEKTSPSPDAKVAEASTKAEPPAAEKVMSPAAQRVVTEGKLDSSTIDGSGKGGRITKEDAMKAAAAPSSSSVSKQPREVKEELPPPVALGGSIGGTREVRREKMTRLRRTIASRLVAAQAEAAMLTTFNEVDMTAVMGIRKEYKDAFKDKHGVGLGFMSFFVKATVEALAAFPRINAYIVGDEIEYHDYCDIGIAVSTDRGLMVPVVRNCESMNFAQIEGEIMAYAQKGRAGKIAPDDLAGGTFTITNGGVFGSLMSTPILTPPQSAILGMHKIQQRPMVVGGEIKVRPMMYLAMTYDHRIVDGKEAVGFLVKVKDCLEDPSRMLIGV